jgi:7-cyano-7-deazaguanine tRNA-ribosyltransferase
MEFFVSWSHSDPHYQLYDPDCAMLISPTTISDVWHLGRFSSLPAKVIIDSGSYTYAANNLPLPSPRATFERQLSILGKNYQLPALLCPLDVPMLEKARSVTQRDRAIEKTIGNAWELKLLMEAYYKKVGFNNSLSYNLTAMAIVQGYDLPSLTYCARRLLEIGFTNFGIGSMAHLYQPKEIQRRVEAVASVVGSNLHLFGVSAIDTIEDLVKLGVSSVDSARPIKAAIYNEIIYSEPYRRFVIAGSKYKETKHKFGAGKLVSRLDLECDCPICQGVTNQDILKFGQRKYLKLRAVHNYHHIKRMLTAY